MASLDDSDMDESSSTMLESPTSYTAQRLGKRKREGTVVIGQSAMVPLHERGYVDGGSLNEALCGTLGQVIHLTEAHPGETGGFASEHMKAVLRLSPDEVAKVLGSSMYLLSWRIRKRRTSHENWSNEPPELFSLLLSPMIALWDLRSTAADGLAGHASNHAFSAHCLMPALHLLSQFEAVKPDAHVSTTIHVLQKLIAGYIIMPTRAALLETVQPGKHLGKRNTALPAEELLRPLQLECSQELEGNVLEGRKGTFTGTLVMIPMTFQLIIKCTFLDTTRRRTAEMPWLQYMFIYLARCASISILAPVSSSPGKSSLTVLEKMLEIGFTSKIDIDSSILENVLSTFSGVLSKEPKKVNWELMRLCLKLDPNVFLKPSPGEEKGKLRQAEHGVNFLAPLLTSITSLGLRTLQEDSVPYRNLLSDIVVPLVAAFAHTRGLNRFIEHWQEQLRIYEDNPRLSTTDMTIWEDEELLHLVARLLEPSLTTGQIEKTFHSAYVDLEQRFAFGGNDMATVAGSSLVIIECIVDGCTNETVTDKLGGTAKLVYGLSLRILQELPYQATKLRWRLWRVTASIRSHWSGVFNSRKISGAEAAVERKAFKKALATLLRSTGLVWLAQDCMEGLQAFKFILSFAPAVHRADLEASAPQHDIDLAIGWVISGLREECEHINPSSDPGWDGRAMVATTQGALLIGCVAQLVLSPKVLSCCASNLQTELLSMLSMCAWQQERLHPAGRSTTIRYPWLWQMLLQTDVLREEASLASCLCRLQVTEYQELTEKGNEGFNGSRQWFVAKGLLSTSMDLFERRQRALLSNCTLQNLLEHHSTMLEQQVADYVSLLVRTIENPNRSLRICTEPSALWILAKALSGSKSIPNTTSCMLSMRRLTDITLSHLISTAPEEKSAEYLRTFFGQLHKELSRTASFVTAPGMLALIGQAMTLFQRHWDAVSQILKNGDPTFIDLRQTHFEILLKDLRTYENSRNDVIEVPLTAERWNFGLGMILDCLSEYADLLGASTPITKSTTMWLDPLDEKVGRALSETIVTTEPSASQHPHIPSMEIVLAKMDRLNASVGRRQLVSPERLFEVMRVLESLRTPLARRNVLGNFKASVETLNSKGKADLLASLIGGDDRGIITDSRLLLFREVVVSIEVSSQNDRTVMDAVSHSMAVLCDQLGRSGEFRNYSLTARCLNLVLQKQPWAVSQWHIDTLLCAITNLTSQSAPKYGRQHAGSIYTTLCRLYSTVLATHRTKIGGRYHLVVPALQGLMRCFFRPHGRNGVSASVLALPPWLCGREPMLEESHAASFVRLLTTICDPTVSSLARSRTRPQRELNDDTKKARSIAGQHLPYVVMVYCQCQLKGRLLPTVKAALTPGLYAILDVMSQDTTRTLNAAMDSSSHAIFKVLYDDYRRFARWEGA
ncbi:MAG: hypothetical protein LQ347_000458 [Umbilicaria vellea]|nr:MAG: hypothetical protein LQ347_000458 [Umbilicaria vellea]